MNKITFENLDQRVLFRFADASDIDVLLRLYEDFRRETDYREILEIDLVKARENLLYLLTRETRPTIVAVVEREVVGYVSYIADSLLTVRPCLTMIELYVAPRFRRSAIGRGLVAMMMLEAKAMGACMAHVSVTSGLPSTNSLFNLFRKAGFTPTGYVMRKALP
jgi:L-amino acid N-acyltransferase YncA